MTDLKDPDIAIIPKGKEIIVNAGVDHMMNTKALVVPCWYLFYHDDQKILNQLTAYADAWYFHKQEVESR